jgi:hypothetical protein
LIKFIQTEKTIAKSFTEQKVLTTLAEIMVLAIIVRTIDCTRIIREN